MENRIKSIKAREILDSRGNPTLEVELETERGRFVDSVPSGASRGKHEAVELRDGGKRYLGKGVRKAVRNVNEIIARRLKGRDVTNEEEIDRLMIELDGRKDKSRLGANAICGVSLAVCRAAAAAERLPLWKHISKKLFSKNSSTTFPTAVEKRMMPRPCFNVINGGAHAGNELDFQEFMVVPQRKSFSENLRAGSEIYHRLKGILAKRFGPLSTNLGDEGGFAPPIRHPQEAVKLILEAAEESGERIKILTDVASSQFFDGKKYKTSIGSFSRQGLLEIYSGMAKKYPMLGFEDPFAEDDFEGWEMAEKNLGPSSLIVGDDLTVTNPERMKLAKEKNLCKAMIIKINQIGTVSEAIEAVRMARDFGWKIIVSHRSGETNDDFIADFALGISAEFIKSGAPARGERLAKYNRLWNAERELKI